MENVGFIHGRFQLFHNDHLKYALEAKKQCRTLLVGITSPDCSSLVYESVDPHRSQKKSNPFTFFERYQMIESALLENGIDRRQFEILPYPIETPQALPNYIPTYATSFFTIYDVWGKEKLNRLSKLGYKTIVLWEKEEKTISSSQIRQLIADNKEWKQFVPTSVFSYIVENHLDDRVREILNNN